MPLYSKTTFPGDFSWVVCPSTFKIDTDGNELDVLLGFSESFGKGVIETVLVETHPSNRHEIESYLNSVGLQEDLTYLEIEGHSNYRRAEKGNTERTKIYNN